MISCCLMILCVSCAYHQTKTCGHTTENYLEIGGHKIGKYPGKEKNDKSSKERKLE